MAGFSRWLVARRPAHTRGELSGKVIIAIARGADITVAANNDVGVQRAADTVCGVGLSACIGTRGGITKELMNVTQRNNAKTY